MDSTIIDLTRDEGDQDVAPSGKRSAAGAAEMNAKRPCITPAPIAALRRQRQQKEESRRRFMNRIKASVAELGKDALVELVMVLAEHRQEAMSAVVAFLKEAAAAGGAPPVPDDVAAEAAVKELMAAVKKAKEEAAEDCGTKYHLIDEGSPVVGVVVRFMEDKVVPLAPGAPQLEMLLGAFRAITSFGVEGKNYDVEPRGSQTVVQIDQLACACIDARASRAAEPAVRTLLRRVNELDFSVIKSYQDFGCFDSVRPLAAPGRAQDVLSQPPPAAAVDGCAAAGADTAEQPAPTVAGAAAAPSAGIPPPSEPLPPVDPLQAVRRPRSRRRSRRPLMPLHRPSRPQPQPQHRPSRRRHRCR